MGELRMLRSVMTLYRKLPSALTGRAAATAFMFAVALGLVFVKPAVAKDAKAVVELFTSQGCSSCPPADAFLGDLTKRDDVIALTLPVDYWDYLGWKDTLASPTHSKRQRAYARRRGDGQVYTPQMVINGRDHAIGSHRSAVNSTIDREADLAKQSWVKVKLSSDKNAIMVSAGDYRGAGKAPDATIWLLLSTKKTDVAIRRGENRGQSISYHNVVRQMVPIGKWTGSAVMVELPKSDLMEGYDGCTAILQVNGAGPILGAAYLDGAMMATTN